MRLALLLSTLLATASPVLAWEEPARGSQTRKDIMSAMRPWMEWQLGAPIQFVVRDLRVEGDVAFAWITAQRPGGGAIDPTRTPSARRGDYDPQGGDPTDAQALLQKSGNVWVATHLLNAATDVWWHWGEFCPVWHPVLPEVCAN